MVKKLGKVFKKLKGKDYKRIMENLSAVEVLQLLIDLIKSNLDELKYYFNTENCQFEYGEKTAYVECLEIIQLFWGKAKEFGLDFDIEGRYPLL